VSPLPPSVAGDASHPNHPHPRFRGNYVACRAWCCPWLPPPAHPPLPLFASFFSSPYQPPHNTLPTTKNQPQMLFLHPTVPIPNVAPNPTSRRSSITITSQSQALLHAHVSDRSKKQHPFPTPLHEREWLNSRPSRCREGDGDVRYFLKKKTSEVGPRPRWTLTSFGDDNCMCAVSGDTSADELRMRAYWGMSAGQTQEQVCADASHPTSLSKCPCLVCPPGPTCNRSVSLFPLFTLHSSLSSLFPLSTAVLTPKSRGGTST